MSLLFPQSHTLRTPPRVRPVVFALSFAVLTLWGTGQEARAEERWRRVQTGRIEVVGNAGERDLQRVATLLEKIPLHPFLHASAGGARLRRRDARACPEGEQTISANRPAPSRETGTGGVCFLTQRRNPQLHCADRKGRAAGVKAEGPRDFGRLLPLPSSKQNLCRPALVGGRGGEILQLLCVEQERRRSSCGRTHRRTSFAPAVRETSASAGPVRRDPAIRPSITIPTGESFLKLNAGRWSAI